MSMLCPIHGVGQLGVLVGRLSIASLLKIVEPQEERNLALNRQRRAKWRDSRAEYGPDLG